MFSISVETDNAFRNYDLDLEHFLNKKLFSSLLFVTGVCSGWFETFESEYI